MTSALLPPVLPRVASLGRSVVRAAPTESVVVGLLLFGFFLSLSVGALQQGIAYDELFHIPAGVTFVGTGVRRLTLDHPPLGHALAGLGAQLVQPVFSTNEYFAGEFRGAAFRFGYKFFEGNAPDQTALLAAARLPLQLSCVLGALYTFLLARTLFGRGPALVALLLLCTAPVYVAWARFVYLDSLLAATCIATLAHLIWFLRSGRYRHLWLLIFASGATLVTKYSGVSCLPVVGLALVVPRRYFGGAPRPLAMRAGQAAVWSSGAVLLAWLCLSCPPDPLFYWRGMTGLYPGTPSDYRFYLLGEFRTSFWYFFPLLVLVKSSIPTLLLSACGLVWGVVSFRRADADSRKVSGPLVLLASFGAVFLAMHAAKALPLGARYLAPLDPILAILAGAGVAFAWQCRERWFKPAREHITFSRCALVVLIGWHVIGSLRTFPDEMAYFNEFVGGPSRGIFVSNDASLDAGQNLPRLARYLRTRGNPQVFLRYHGTDHPARHGIRSLPLSAQQWDKPTPGLYVIATYPLVYGQLESRERPEHLDWLNRLTPTAKVGFAYYVYDLRRQRSASTARRSAP